MNRWLYRMEFVNDEPQGPAISYTTPSPRYQTPHIKPAQPRRGSAYTKPKDPHRNRKGRT